MYVNVIASNWKTVAFCLSCLFLQKPWALSSYSQLTAATKGLACPWGVAGREGSRGQGKGPCPPLLPWLLQLCSYETQLCVHNRESMGSPCVWALCVVTDHGGQPFLLTAGVPLGQEGECRSCPAWTVFPGREEQRAPLTLTLIKKKKKCASIREHQKWQILKNKPCQQKQRLSFL